VKIIGIASAATKRVPNAPGAIPATSGANALTDLPAHSAMPATEIAALCAVIATANVGQERSVPQDLTNPRAVTVIVDRVPSRETFVATAVNGRTAATCARRALSVHSAAQSVATDSVRAVVIAPPSEAIAKAPLSGATTALVPTTALTATTVLAKTIASAETVGKRSLSGRVFDPEPRVANGPAAIDQAK
jgi:hypothetical protein